MSIHSLEDRLELVRSGVVPTTAGGSVADRVLAIRKEYRELGLYNEYCADNGVVRLADIDLNVMVEAIAARKAGEDMPRINFVAARPVSATGGLRLQVSDPTPAPAVAKVAPVVAKPAAIEVDAAPPVAKSVRAAKLPQFLDEDDASLEAAPAPVVEPAVVVVPEPVRVPVKLHSGPMAPGTTAGKYANVATTPRTVIPVNVTGTALVQAAPAPKAAMPVAKPVVRPASGGYISGTLEAELMERGDKIVACTGQKKRGGKLVPCGCSGFANTMVAPSVENLKRLHFGNPRPEDVLAQARCRASSLVDTRGFRWFSMLEVEARVTDAAAEYDRSLMEDGRLGKITGKLGKK